MKIHGNSGTDLSAAERKVRVHALRVQFPSRGIVLGLLERCLADSEYSADPKCLFIGGHTGAGKSSLIDAFIARYPRINGETVDTIPVLAAAIPAVATTKGTVSSLLAALGDSKAYQGELARLTGRLLHYLRVCRVRIIIVDEFQHVIDRDSSKVLARTADLLKTIVNQSHIPLVLVGLPHSERILEENPQLSRRFSRRTLLSGFGFKTPEQRKEFRKLLELIDRNLPFAVSAGLDHPETAEWFFKHTQGTLGLVMMLVREAAERAIDRGADRIERNDLIAALAQTRTKPIPPSPTSPRGGTTKPQRKPSVSEVLHT